MRKLALLSFVLLASVALAYTVTVTPSSGSYPTGVVKFTCNNDFRAGWFVWYVKYNAYDEMFQRITTANGYYAQYNFTDRGTYEVRCYAYVSSSSSAGAFGSSSIKITSGNYRPLLSTSPGSQVFPAPKNVTITFNGSDPDGNITKWSVNWGDGTPAGNFTADNKTFSSKLTHYFAKKGYYTVKVRATDNKGSNSTWLAFVTIQNTPPVARPPSVDCTENGQPSNNCLFDFSNSTDPDGDAMTYWGYIDLIPGKGCNPPGAADCTIIVVPAGAKSVRHQMKTKGNHSVLARVYDGKGGDVISTNVSFEVPNPRPVSRFDAPTCRKEEACEFDGSASSDDGSISSYEWDFGDNDTAAGSVVNHSFNYSGDYDVKLTVTDDDGAATSLTKSVHVQQLVADQSAGNGLTDDQPFGPAAVYPNAVAESFIPGVATLDAVSVYASNPQGGLLVSIRSSLDGADLWWDNVSAASLNANDFTTIPINGSLAVTPGNTYYLVLNATWYSGMLDNLVSGYNSSNSYAAGDAWKFDKGANAWVQDVQDRDYLFKTLYWN